MHLSPATDPTPRTPRQPARLALSPWRRKPTPRGLRTIRLTPSPHTALEHSGSPPHPAQDSDQAIAQIINRAVTAALSAERKRMAADLHDDLGGALAVLAQRSTDAQLAAVARTALANMRGLLRGCIDEITPFADVCADMRAEVAQLCELSGVQLNWVVNTNGDNQLPNPGTRLHAQRVLREAVTNALRHSFCTHLWVEWRVIGRAISLTVADNGCGIEPTTSSPRPPGHGLGLCAMQTRAQRLGGSIEISAATGGGTRVDCVLPF